MLKGVLTAEDARRAVEHGAAAVVVSNHGGRQLDGVSATIDALPQVVEAVDGRAEVLLDSGVRRGVDVLRALALGARAVLVGRAVAYGLAAGGEAGVRAVLGLLRDEVELGLRLLGCASPAEVDAGARRVEAVILARHGESVFSERLLVNGKAAVAGPLTPRGVEEAEQLGRRLADDPIDLCVTTEFERTRQTADVALAGRDVPRVVVRRAERSASTATTRAARSRTTGRGRTVRASSDDAPGGGESRRHIVERYVRGFRLVPRAPRRRALVVAHSLPIAYVLAALDGAAPAPRVPLVEARASAPARRRTSSREPSPFWRAGAPHQPGEARARRVAAPLGGSRARGATRGATGSNRARRRAPPLVAPAAAPR